MKWAPFTTPFLRRRETFAIILWVALMPMLVSLFLFFFYNTNYQVYLIAYLIYAKIDTSPETGGRKKMWLRKLSYWRWLADYFPMQLVKTSELDPRKNYVFGYHPHGIISLGAFTCFGTEARDFSKLFPGINVRVLTLTTNFFMPLFRDLLLNLGFCSVTRRSCENILSSGPGNSILIVPGGAAESLYAFPGVYDLVLKKRLGFIKVAVRHGASLVPVIAFGENDIWNQVHNPKGSVLRRFQTFFQKYLSFAPPLFHGRGVFQYSYGILPHRRHLTVCVGEPIEVEKLENPTSEQLLSYQKKYLDGLENLFNKQKELYAPNRKGELTFVE